MRTGDLSDLLSHSSFPGDLSDLLSHSSFPGDLSDLLSHLSFPVLPFNLHDLLFVNLF